MAATSFTQTSSGLTAAGAIRATQWRGLKDGGGHVSLDLGMQLDSGTLRGAEVASADGGREGEAAARRGSYLLDKIQLENTVKYS